MPHDGRVDDWLDDRRPVRRVQRRPDAAPDPAAWPYRLAPVAQLLRDGLDLPAGVTFLVGENGSGKSTVVEAVAAEPRRVLRGGRPPVPKLGERVGWMIELFARMEQEQGIRRGLR